MQKVNTLQRPRIGLAMSGAAARSVFYIGFLESLVEQNIPIDYIAASSGASLVAACFACGNLDKLKSVAMTMDRKLIFSLLERGKGRGGWYNLDGFENFVREEFTKGKKFEEVSPNLCFLAADLEEGEIVELSMGDIAHAVRISSTVPGVFEPTIWGSKTLVDGGLLNYIPGTVVRNSGVDVVVGVHVRATKHIFKKNQLILKNLYNQIKRFLLVNQIEVLFKKLGNLSEQVDLTDLFENVEMFEKEDPRNKGMFSILGRSLDLAIEASKKTQAVDPNFGCDLLITTGSGNFGGSVDLRASERLYLDGKLSGEHYGKEIRLLMQKRMEEMNKQYVR